MWWGGSGMVPRVREMYDTRSWAAMSVEARHRDGVTAADVYGVKGWKFRRSRCLLSRRNGHG